MSDLISRKEAKDAIYESFTPYQSAWAEKIRQVWNAIDSVPAVEAVPVVHGEWIHIGGDEWCCSVCDYVISTEGSWEKPKGKFCEECGADMRKEGVI